MVSRDGSSVKLIFLLLQAAPEEVRPSIEQMCANVERSLVSTSDLFGLARLANLRATRKTQWGGVGPPLTFHCPSHTFVLHREIQLRPICQGSHQGINALRIQVATSNPAPLPHNSAPHWNRYRYLPPPPHTEIDHQHQSKSIYIIINLISRVPAKRTGEVIVEIPTSTQRVPYFCLSPQRLPSVPNLSLI